MSTEKGNNFWHIDILMVHVRSVLFYSCIEKKNVLSNNGIPNMDLLSKLPVKNFLNEKDFEDVNKNRLFV